MIEPRTGLNSHVVHGLGDSICKNSAENLIATGEYVALGSIRREISLSGKSIHVTEVTTNRE